MPTRCCDTKSRVDCLIAEAIKHDPGRSAICIEPENGRNRTEGTEVRLKFATQMPRDRTPLRGIQGALGADL